MKVFLSPHCDDETLFGAYTILRHRPQVLVCFNGRQATHLADDREREAETLAAMEILEAKVAFLRCRSAPSDWGEVEQRLTQVVHDPEVVWAPLFEDDGQSDHNGVALVAARLWPGRVAFYATYTGAGVKSRVGTPVPVEPGWHDLKQRALACYRSQIERPGTAQHWEQGLDEYVIDAPVQCMNGTVKLNLACGSNPLDGFVNLDKRLGWRFEDGLGDYQDASVDAITVSHALMYVRLEEWPGVFAEFSRVLKPGGVLRVTEDAIGAEGSSRPVIRPKAAVATTRELVIDHMLRARLVAGTVTANSTFYRDGSLVQTNYGDEPDVFHVEGVKS